MAGPRYGRLNYDMTKQGLDINDGGADLKNTAMKLGTEGSEDVVIFVGDITANADSGFAPGSIGLDTADGLLYVSNSSGEWKVVTVT